MAGFPYLRLRSARPTDRLAQQRRFFVEGVGLALRSEFQGHEGYDGFVVGDPGGHWQLEFVHQSGHAAAIAPDPENLYVFYVHDRKELARRAAALDAIGAPRVEPANPYWRRAGVTFEDPDGLHIVIALTPTFLASEEEAAR